MSEILPFCAPSADHVLIEHLKVRRDGGLVVFAYFVSPVLDGALIFGEYETNEYTDARAEADAYKLRIVDKTEAR